MAKPTSKQRQNHFLSPVEAIVRRRQKVSLAELIDLIHQVNPTDRILDKSETEERYRLKSRLQSFLIENYQELVEVQAMPGNEERYVALSVRGNPRGACHARLDQLEPEARGWVRIQLDTQGACEPEAGFEPFGPGEKTSKRESDPIDPLAKARRALADYDYELARQMAELAWHERADEEAALFLLELLIDHLALFSEALAFGDRLPPTMARSRAIRCLLARAAAEAGKFTLARELLHKLTGITAAEAWLAVGHAALAKEDPATAEQGLREAARLDDTLPGMDDLRKAILCEQTRSLLPQIEGLLDSWRAGIVSGDEAEIEARGFLNAGLKHPGLTELLRIRAEQKKEAALLAAITQAESYYAKGDYILAAQNYAMALDLGGEARLRERLAEAKKRAQSQKEEAHLAGLVERMKADSLREALVDYLELSASQRLRVKQLANRREIETVEELAESARGVSGKALVAAALALHKAREVLALGDFRQSLALIEPHKSLVKKSPPARLLEAEALEGLARECRALAVDKIRQVKEAMRHGRPAEAAALLEAIDPAALSPEEDALLEQFRQRTAIEGERRRLERELLDNEEKENWFQARENLGALRELGRAEELLLQDRQREIDLRLKQRYRLRYIDLHGGKINLADTRYSIERERCQPWLLEDGQTLALPASHGPWVIIRLIDIDTATGQGAIVFRVEEGLDIQDFLAQGDKFWIAGGRGEVLVIAQDGSTIRAVHPPCQHLGENEIVESVLLAPPQHVWLHARDFKLEKERVVVLDLAKRGLREVGDALTILRLPGSQPLRVIRTMYPRERVLVHTGPGHRTLPDEITSISRVEAVVMASEGPGLAVVNTVETDEADDAPHMAISWVADEDGRPGHILELPEAWGEFSHCLATARDAGCSFLYCRTGDNNDWDLAAFGVSGQGITEKWRVSGVAEPLLVSDFAAGRVLAVFLDVDHEFTVAELGNRPPKDLPCRKCEPAEPSFGMRFLSCSRKLKHRRAQELAVTGMLHSLSRAQQDAMLERYVEQRDADQLLAFHGALMLARHFDRAQVLFERLVKIIPDNPEVVILHCDSLNKEGKFAEGLAILEKIDFKADHGEPAEHLCHLLGLARLRQGDPAGALSAWKVGLEYEGGGDCQLKELVHYVEQALQVAGGEEIHENIGRYAWLIQGLRLADRYLHQGQPGQVLKLLDHGRFWKMATPDSLARLVRACLLKEPADGAERLRWLIILAAFVAKCDEKPLLDTQWPLPAEYRITPEDLRELQEKALQWLDGV